MISMYQAANICFLKKMYMKLIRKFSLIIYFDFQNIQLNSIKS